MGSMDETGLTLFITHTETQIARRLNNGMENEWAGDKERMFGMTIRLKINA